MLPVVERNTAQFPGPGQRPEPGGLNGEGICHDSECKDAASEKNSHAPRQSPGDSLRDASDASESSYHTAPCSEGAESFKDCAECLEAEAGAVFTPWPEDDSGLQHREETAAPGSRLEPNRAGTKAEQRLRAPWDRHKATWVLPVKTSKPVAATGSRSAANRSQASGGSLTTTAEGLFSRLPGRECATSNPVCSSGGYASAKERQQVQMSITAMNSTAPRDSGRRGLARPELPPGDGGSNYLNPPLHVNAPKSRAMFLKARLAKGSRAPVISQAACPWYCTESDSEEADNEVQKLTALSFRSLSCPHGGSLDMYSSSTSNSLSDDSKGANRWSPRNETRKAEVVSQAKGSKQFPVASQVPETDPPGCSLGKERTDAALESADGRRGHSKKRTVPKRQIQLQPRDWEEMNLLAAEESAAPQPFAAPRSDPHPKGRTISEEFRVNYKQFVRTASLDDSGGKTQMASCLVKNVLAKKMQYEQRIRMEQKSMQSSSTSSVPSSVSTDLVGDFAEGKSSSLSKSDGSCSAEDLLSQSASERSESVALSPKSPDVLRPAKGVVLTEQQRENVCKLKKTFNELNERLKSQEAGCSKVLPVLADGVNGDSSSARKQVARGRKEYQRARALFESMEAEAKGLGVGPMFSRAQKPWPSLKQRAISKRERVSQQEKVPLQPKSSWLPQEPASSTFTSTAQEVKLIPQSKRKQQQKMLNVSKHLLPEGGSGQTRPAAAQSTRHSSLILPTSCRSRSNGENSVPGALHAQEPKKAGSKGKGRIHQPRDVRKLVKNTYSLCFKSSDSLNADQEASPGGSIHLPTKEPTATSPLFIHCSSVRRKEDVQTETESHDKKAQRVSDLQHGTALNPASEPHGEGPVSPTKSKCTTASDSPMHITQIQSKKKVVAGNEEPQRKPGNKPVHYERSELNVTPSSRRAPQMESQLNIKVNSSLSKYLHKPQADHFPAPTYSALGGKGTTDSSTRANYSSLAKSEALLFPSSASPEGTENLSDAEAKPGHFQEALVHKGPEWPCQKHLSTETISLTTHHNQDFSGSPKEEDTVSEPDLAKESYGHLQPIKPTVTSTQTSHRNPPANNQSVNSSHQQKAQNTTLDAPCPSASWGFMPATCVPPERASPSASLRSKASSKGTRPPGVPPAAPSPPDGRRGSWGHLTRPQAGHEPYFTATHAENTNYLTIPTKAQKAEVALKPPMPLHPDHAPLGSQAFSQPGGEGPASAPSQASPPLSVPDGKGAADHSWHDPPSRPQPHPRVDGSPSFLRRSSGVSPGGQSAPSPPRALAPQAHRKMLVDPESGKCYYMEPPRQPQLKTLYDPETGQYIEVLMPAVPLAPHSRLYSSPFNPLVLNPGVYGAPYVPYTGFPGLPPPPVALPAIHPDVPTQPSGPENTNVAETFSPGAKGEAPSAPQTPDCNYMESLYYIPTGMNSSPSPNQLLFSPATSASPSMPEKAPLFQM
ncbi:proline-rich basic protein 1 [Carettochelys insculpta]|uniref:proline-rich basic protein 1 n=1 Tax=Carettochelys insculpta TaxID=44489 RepID=UPI003EB8CD2F